MIADCFLCVSDLAAAWSSILVFDATVFVLTLTQALRVGRMFSHSLFHIMLRDGEPVHDAFSCVAF